MTISSQQFRNHIGQHNNRLQAQACVPVHTKKPGVHSKASLTALITHVAHGPDLEFIERQADSSQPKIKCATKSVVFTLLACAALTTTAGLIIREIIDANNVETVSLLKTEHLEQGKMEYFSDNRMEYTLEKGHDGYLQEHENLSLKKVYRPQI